MSPCERRQLRSDFERHRWLRLPALLDGEALGDLQRRTSAAVVARRELPGVGRLAVTVAPGLYALGILLLNREPFFRFLEEVTGLPRVRGFDGQTYRLEPNAGQDLDWHDDRNEPGRILGISINLGDRPYQGGEFQLRD